MPYLISVCDFLSFIELTTNQRDDFNTVNIFYSIQMLYAKCTCASQRYLDVIAHGVVLQ